MPSDAAPGRGAAFSEGPLILAFDTSAAQCAAALVQDTRTLARRIEPMDRGQAERLAPLLEEILAESGAVWSDLGAIALCSGPGNFTGLRIAVATARGLALALGIPAIGITLFEALAWGHDGPVFVTAQDRRGDLFAQHFLDGAAIGAPVTAELGNLEHLSPETLCLGYRAGEIALRLGCRAGSETAAPDPASLARVALPRLGHSNPRPAPLYLRRADALPSTEPATLILEEFP